MTEWPWAPRPAVETMCADLLTLFGGSQDWGGAGDLEEVLTRPQMLAVCDNSVDA
jgi:hypothetical protein